MSLPLEEAKRRISKVQKLIAGKDLDYALVYYDELNIANGWYLSGWCPQFESGMVLVPSEGEPMILGGPESEPFAHTDSAIKNTRNIPVFMVPDEEYPNAVISSFKEVFSEIDPAGKAKRIGVAGMPRIPLGLYRDIVSQLEGMELIDITEEYEALRIIKSPHEIDQIHRAFAIADASYKAAAEALKPGISEFEMAAEAECTGRRLGANGFGFKTIAAVGKRSNGCVPTASANRLRAGDLLLFGCSPKSEGYCSAAGNTLVVGGKPTPRQKELLADLGEAFARTKEMLRIGVSGKEIDAPARRYFKEKGYLDHLICPFAHTVGLNEAEAPFFGPNSSDVIEENMCINIDVSFFGHPEFYGVRIETGYLITKEGPKPFSPMMDGLLLGAAG